MGKDELAALTAREGEAMVQRYEASRYSGMIPSSVGGWVKYTDYAALAERVRVLEEALRVLLAATPQEECEADCDVSNCPWMQAKALLAQPAQSGDTDKQADASEEGR